MKLTKKLMSILLASSMLSALTPAVQAAKSPEQIYTANMNSYTMSGQYTSSAAYYPWIDLDGDGPGTTCGQNPVQFAENTAQDAALEVFLTNKAGNQDIGKGQFIAYKDGKWIGLRGWGGNRTTAGLVMNKDFEEITRVTFEMWINWDDIYAKSMGAYIVADESMRNYIQAASETTSGGRKLVLRSAVNGNATQVASLDIKKTNGDMASDVKGNYVFDLIINNESGEVTWSVVCDNEAIDDSSWYGTFEHTVNVAGVKYPLAFYHGGDGGRIYFGDYSVYYKEPKEDIFDFVDDFDGYTSSYTQSAPYRPMLKSGSEGEYTYSKNTEDFLVHASGAQWKISTDGPEIGQALYKAYHADSAMYLGSWGGYRTYAKLDPGKPLQSVSEMHFKLTPNNDHRCGVRLFADDNMKKYCEIGIMDKDKTSADENFGINSGDSCIYFISKDAASEAMYMWKTPVRTKSNAAVSNPAGEFAFDVTVSGDVSKQIKIKVTNSAYDSSNWDYTYIDTGVLSTPWSYPVSFFAVGDSKPIKIDDVKLMWKDEKEVGYTKNNSGIVISPNHLPETGDMTVISAFYNNGRLTDIDARTVTDDENYIVSSSKSYTDIKVFAWDRLDNMKPYTKIVEQYAVEQEGYD